MAHEKEVPIDASDDDAVIGGSYALVLKELNKGPRSQFYKENLDYARSKLDQILKDAAASGSGYRKQQAMLLRNKLRFIR